MSVDKFGRSAHGKQALRYPKSKGFNLTVEGNFDIENKLLCNVGDPVHLKDGANLQTVRAQVSSCLQLNNKRKYDAKSYTICNLGKPTEKDDAVTMEFLESKLNECVTYQKDTIDARSKRIDNVMDPTQETDAVNLRYLQKKCPKKVFDGWNFLNKRIKMVKDPLDMSDAVSLNYLVRVLSEILYKMYKQLAKDEDTIHITTKDEWIRNHIVDPHFINKDTKIFRTPE